MVKKIENELALKLAGTSPEEIRSQEANVKEAEARVDSYQAQIAKTILRSPIGGVVTKKSASIGEVASLNIPILSVISDNKLEIEANVPEIDIGKVSKTNEVKIVFDAFPQESFAGKVSYIDPAETIVDGVSNFKIKIALAGYDPRMKSGLTANLSIVTYQKDNALIVPVYAISENAEGYFVTRISGKKIEEVPVALGIKNQNGDAEIISGLKEGDLVLTEKK